MLLLSLFVSIVFAVVPVVVAADTLSVWQVFENAPSLPSELIHGCLLFVVVVVVVIVIGWLLVLFF